MRNLLSKIATYSLLGGLLFFSVRAYYIYEIWNVNREPQKISAVKINTVTGHPVFLQVNGGKLDLDNAYETHLEHKKTNAEFAKRFFIPVIGENSQLLYVLQTKLVPTSADITGEPSFVGLVSLNEGLSEEMSGQFSNKYSFKGDIPVLDASYKPKSHMEMAHGLVYPSGFIALGIFLIIVLGRTAPKAEPQNVSPPESETLNRS